tara:strand:- start:111 stop:401 length:291 start_codon:yes stop_codon:yes gene_type:complete
LLATLLLKSPFSKKENLEFFFIFLCCTNLPTAKIVSSSCPAKISPNFFLKKSLAISKLPSTDACSVCPVFKLAPRFLYKSKPNFCKILFLVCKAAA